MDSTDRVRCAPGARRREARTGSGAWLAGLALAVLVAACAERADRAPAPAPAAAGTIRLIAPAEPPSTAALPRAEIAGESRYVLAANPAVVLRSREEVTLPAAGALAVEAAPPAHLAGRDVRLDAWASTRDPSSPARTMVELREGRRITTTAPPRIVHAGDGDGSALALPVPAGLGGQAALLTVVARPLPANPTVTDSEPVVVPTGARLAFGYAVEEPGWTPGWPPVRFAVAALGEDGGETPLFERRVDPAADARDRRWFDASVDLAALAGRRVRFRFAAEAMPVAGAAVTRSFPVVSNPAVVPPGARDGRWNVVLVSLDTLRARSVGAYGAPVATTPQLDARLAAAGTLVRQAVTPFAFTPPAHMTLFTGLDPCVHGMRDLHTRLAPGRPTLTEALRAAGWATAAFTEDAYLVAGNGFDRGFDVYQENRSEESPSPGFAAGTFGAATRWLEAQAREPFFLFVHTYQVHDPYTPPRGYAGLFADQPAADDNQRALREYEREVRYTDDVLADFLDRLETLGLAERTLVVVTSDHGEGFGEHFWTGHGFDVHDEAMLVPLVFRAPGLVTRGRVVEEQVTLADVAPTILDLLGVPPLPDVQGRSFAGLLTGRGGGFDERPVLLSATSGMEGVRTRRWKLVVHPKAELFYALDRDPLERENLIPANPPALAEARQALADAKAACARVQAAAPPAAAPAAESQPAWMVNRDEVERKLKSLGYIQ